MPVLIPVGPNDAIPTYPPNVAVSSQTAPVLVNGTLSSGNVAFIDTATGGGTYTCATNINVQLSLTGSPPAGFIEINTEQPYQFTAAQAAQLIATGVALFAT